MGRNRSLSPYKRGESPDRFRQKDDSYIRLKLQRRDEANEAYWNKSVGIY